MDISIDQAVILLNELVDADRVAIQELLKLRVKCNDNIRNHPTVQVKHISDGDYCVGILGIINGLFGVNPTTGMGYIGARLDDNKQLINFERL